MGTDGTADETPDEATGETTSHLTGETPSHSTSLSKNDTQVAGYRLFDNDNEVIG